MTTAATGCISRPQLKDTRWYFIRSTGLGDGDPGNGEETGQRSDFSQGAQGMASVVISIECITPGVSGDGTAPSPYQLTPGMEYDFTATSQTGTDLTFVVDWSVVPPASAEFSIVTPGHLQDIIPGPAEITVQAGYSLLEFNWTGSAVCSVSGP